MAIRYHSRELDASYLQASMQAHATEYALKGVLTDDSVNLISIHNTVECLDLAALLNFTPLKSHRETIKNVNASQNKVLAMKLTALELARQYKAFQKSPEYAKLNAELDNMLKVAREGRLKNIFAQ